MAYSGWIISEKSKEEILKRFPPRFPDVFVHHITEIYSNVKSESLTAPEPATIEVFGYASDDSLEALLVTVNGFKHTAQGRPYHITVSLDRSRNRAPSESSSVIMKNGFMAIDSLMVEAEPKVIKY